MSYEENQEAAVHCSGGTSPDMVATSGQDDPTTVEPGSQYSPVFMFTSALLTKEK